MLVGPALEDAALDPVIKKAFALEIVLATYRPDIVIPPIVVGI
jgi:hypothetical protein